MFVALFGILLAALAVLALLKLTGVISATWMALLQVIWIPGSVILVIAGLFLLFHLLYWIGRLFSKDPQKEASKLRKDLEQKRRSQGGFRLDRNKQGSATGQKTSRSRGEQRAPGPSSEARESRSSGSTNSEGSSAGGIGKPPTPPNR